VKTPGRLWAPSHNPATHTPAAHAKQAQAITGAANPAKRPSVRKAISAKVRASHPSLLYPKLWAALARSMKPPKVSSLERRLAPFFPRFKPQVRIGPYAVDFADEPRKRVIEVNGCWHHCCPYCEIKPASPTQLNTLRDDKRKATYLRNRGWRLTIVWGCKLEEFIDDAGDHSQL